MALREAPRADPLATRVAWRVRAADIVLRKKFFADKRKELLKLFRDAPAKYRSPSGFAYFAYEVVNWWRNFSKDVMQLLADSEHPQVQQEVKSALDDGEEYLKNYEKTFDTLNDALHLSYDGTRHSNDPMDVVKDRIKLDAGSWIEAQFEKSFASAFNVRWKIDPRMIEALARRIVKGMPEDVRQTFAAEYDHEEFGHPIWKQQYEYLREVGLQSKVPRIIEKGKANLSATDLFDRIVRILDSWSDPEKQQRHFRIFDLNGMRVVVDDSTVSEYEIAQYVKYLDHAHKLLKIKRLDKVWYGTVFIRCKDCGGVNPHTLGGTGGNYPIGPDVVNIFSRPSEFIVELIAHELGHLVQHAGPRGELSYSKDEYQEKIKQFDLGSFEALGTLRTKIYDEIVKKNIHK